MKIQKPKRLIATLLILTILTISMYSALMPTAYAQPTSQIQEKSLSVLDNVFGLDTEKYSIATKEYQQDATASYFGLVSQENVAYSLTSESSKLKMHYTFGNGNLQMIQVLDKEGTPNLVKASANNAIEMAKDFLTNYQTHTGNQLFGDLKSTLSNLEVDKNITKTTGDITLEMATYNDYTNFKWYYTANGAKAPYTKYIVLGFKDGFLATFVDNWQFFNVGSTNINLSEEEAIAIALNTAKEYANKLKLNDYGLEEVNINQTNVRWTALLFDHSLNASKARSTNALELYPAWRIGVALDKWYGSLYGLEVEIWADTKEVRSVQEAWSTVPPPEGAPTANINANEAAQASPNTASWFVLSTIAIALTGTASIMMACRKKHISLPNLLKTRPSKAGALLLCIITVSMVFLAPISTVSAWSKTGIIWGSESSGANEPGYLSPNDNWRKSYQERQFQMDTSVYLTNYFQNYGGYYSYKHQRPRKPRATKMQKLHNDIDIQTAINSRVVFVTFDHGVGNYINGEFHFMFEDQTGTGIGTHDNHYWDVSHGIYDEEIYNAIDEKDRGKTTLAFINTCMSARLTTPTSETDPWQGLYNGRARGLPFAFTHREVKPWNMQGFNVNLHMSNRGYDHPDSGSQVYIGFPKGSASLEQGIPFGGGGGNPYYWWVTSFFYNAVALDKSINQALDAASNQFIGGPFLSTPLQTGFNPYWWNFEVPPEWRNGTLEIYGNGRIHLKGFGDDFNDGNYNGWTVTQGSWSASSGILRAQQGYSLIRTGQQFASDRHVRATVRTITSGPNTWDVAWIMAKYVDSSNQVYGLLHTNGVVELAIFKNGQKLMWSAATGLSPFTTRIIDIDIVGNKAYVYVDGHVRLSVTHDWLDDFGGYTAFYTHQSSTADFDDMTVVIQSG